MQAECVDDEDCMRPPARTLQLCCLLALALGADRFCHRGLLEGSICCPPYCGQCGGAKCAAVQTGGADLCCTSNIAARQPVRSCTMHDAPCVVEPISGFPLWRNPASKPGGLPHEDGYALRHSWEHFRLLYVFLLLWLPLLIFYATSKCCWKYEKLTAEQISDRFFNDGAVQRKAQAHLRKKSISEYKR